VSKTQTEPVVPKQIRVTNAGAWILRKRNVFNRLYFKTPTWAFIVNVQVIVSCKWTSCSQPFAPMLICSFILLKWNILERSFQAFPQTFLFPIKRFTRGCNLKPVLHEELLTIVKNYRDRMLWRSSLKFLIRTSLERMRVVFQPRCKLVLRNCKVVWKLPK
jgi:hypothetical protein